jgi:hypothetical protein
VTKAKISEYSATAGDNTDVNGTNIAEGCAPSGINDAIREVMAALKRFETGADGDSVTVGGNLVVSGSTTLANTATLSNVTSATLAAGSNSAPTLHASGDTNTGVYFPAADQVAVAAGGSVAAAFNSHQFMGMRNRIINGDMRIDQRNAGASVSVDGTFPYITDRWQVQDFTDGVVSAQQVTDAPTGYVNSLKVTVTTADATLASNQIARTQQPIEGVNISDLAWGSASAKTVTLSFWVRSSVTGTFGGALINSGNTRSYPFTYSISVADTWEQKSVTVAGDTSGTWLTTTGIGIQVLFSLAAGSSFLGTAGAWAGADYRGATGQTNLMATLNATWYVTGVQFEVGSVATPFERRPFGTELALCQRYFESSNTTGILAYIPGACYVSTEIYSTFFYVTTKRTTPSVVFRSTDWSVFSNGSARTFTSIAADGIGITNVAFYIIGSGWSAGNSAFVRNTGVNAIQVSAEL